MKLSIRPIEAMDIGALKKMTKDFMKERKNTWPVIDDTELDNAMLQVLLNTNNPEYLQLIALDGKKPAGFFLGYMAMHPYGNPRRVAVAREMYVVPNKRDKFIGYKLAQRAFQMAVERGAQAIECAGTYGDTDKRWERFGFTLHLTYGHMDLAHMDKLFGRKEKHESISVDHY